MIGWIQKMPRWAGWLNDAYFATWCFLVVTLATIALLVAIFTFVPVTLPGLLGEFGVLFLFTVWFVAFSIHFSILTLKLHFPFVPRPSDSDFFL
jgi:hypothetical protein